MSHRMPTIEIYSTPICPYCHAAKSLLQHKKVAFKDIDIYSEPARRKEMIRRAGGRTTVPQIFIGSFHVGGCDDLHALERAGKLNVLLNGGGAGP
jgi:glutaredoxin 3